MKELEKDEKVSMHGELDIKFLKNNKEEIINISIENKEVRKLIEVLYDFLWKQYAKFDYKWEEIEKKIETTKIVVNGNLIETERYINVYGYVKKRSNGKNKYGKKYDFYIIKIKIKELLEYLEKICDNYILDFNTTKDRLKFVIEKIEIL